MTYCPNDIVTLPENGPNFISPLEHFGITVDFSSVERRTLPPLCMPWLYADKASLVLKPDNGPSFDCSKPNHITVGYQGTLPLSFFEQMLFERAVPLSYLNNGYIALHAACVLIGNSAYVIAGESGVGKSTLAAACQELGYTVVADDCFMLRPHEDSIELKVCSDTIRLHTESLSLLNIPSNKVRPGPKLSLPTNIPRASTYFCKKITFMFLDPNTDSLRPITGSDYFKRFCTNVWFAQLIQERDPSFLLKFLALLAPRTEAFIKPLCHTSRTPYQTIEEILSMAVQNCEVLCSVE